MSVTKGRARPRAKPITYLATNLINGKRYVGVSMYGLGNRRAHHVNDAMVKQSKQVFHRALRKYGKEMFRFIVLSRYPTYEEALADEERLVDLWKPEYNVGRGGIGNAGWHHTEAQRQKISERNKGMPGFWKGKKLPDHVRRLFVEKAAQPEQQEKWKVWGLLGSQSIQRKVICTDDGQEYESVRLAARFYGISEKAVNSVCHGRSRKANGRSFCFADGSTPAAPKRPKGKMTIEQVAEVRLAAAAGASRTELAQRYSRSYVTIQRILAFKTFPPKEGGG